MKEGITMNDSFIHVLVILLSMLAAIAIIVILNKTGLLTKLTNGQLFREGQDGHEANSITY